MESIIDTLKTKKALLLSLKQNFELTETLVPSSLKEQLDDVQLTTEAVIDDVVERGAVKEAIETEVTKRAESFLAKKREIGPSLQSQISALASRNANFNAKMRREVSYALDSVEALEFQIVDVPLSLVSKIKELESKNELLKSTVLSLQETLTETVELLKKADKKIN